MAISEITTLDQVEGRLYPGDVMTKMVWILKKYNA
jgi:hypothetical protein